MKFLFQKKRKVKIVRVWFSQKKKLEKLKLENFAPTATLKVRVDFFFRVIVGVKVSKKRPTLTNFESWPSFVLSLNLPSLPAS